MSVKQSLLSAISILFLPALPIAQQPAAPVPPPMEVGSATNEFRAAWIATVTNIDWPTKGTTDPAKQREEYIRMLDMHKKNGLNAVIAQVRPAADAFYPSPYEPWSEWLTGKQGKPPVPYYDPLQFMINEAHQRGMEFHAWLNPYRAVFNIKTSVPDPNHITRTFPEWFLNYGDKKYFDPGNKNAQQFVVNIVRDLVKRYPVDGIHFDDYFYPYRIAGKEFPDQKSYKVFGVGMSVDEWRRSNVDSIIRHLAVAIKAEKPWVKFGISPFGVWRNNDKDPRGSATTAGQTNYDDLYADILLWLKEGWIDYVAPQLYWEFGHKAAAFEVLLDWWSKNTYGKHCYIGLGIYRAGSNSAWKDPNQLPRMIQAVRNTPNMHGVIYFSSKSFEKNPNGWNDSLRNNYYRDPASIPSMEWMAPNPRSLTY
ncbi:glycoside hydrolase family 10 protein [Flavihumibacter cheonanensis]|jgi:uncharacterized lipoprotein YddW (UPF0748 family)|uniref:glycoside hydrolase family 10 protein n=1 Tax=Flavihumibacter cheonanensis TaxID=1442385 RepID=UPI001EF7CCC8|nr:family 10 glycosylhydrolase [Flavihumibacter cheonanensis]MCG7754752.1 family 10 glycosylhydrolase [Flavihumibacter cheonanensis]